MAVANRITVSPAELVALLGDKSALSLELDDERFNPPTDLINQYIRKTYNPKRGDLIHFESLGDYRNEGLYIWDGKCCLDLNYDCDDYGNLPKEFRTISEFPIGYFHGPEGISHNDIIWVDIAPHMDEIVENLEYTNLWKSRFLVADTEYEIFMYTENNLSREQVIEKLKSPDCYFSCSHTDIEIEPSENRLFLDLDLI